jgi:hypothetical protein
MNAGSAVASLSSSSVMSLAGYVTSSGKETKVIANIYQRKWPEEKISVGLEPISGFNLRAQVVGRGGDNVKFIQQETSCKVQIKGRGSGFMEPQSGQESDEPMYLHIAYVHPEARR